MVTVDLSTFMQQVIERVGREPDSIDGNTYTWENSGGEVELVVGSKMADIEVDLHVNLFADDPADSFYHRYELTDAADWNGQGGGLDETMYTYDDLVEAVGLMIAANLNLG